MTNKIISKEFGNKWYPPSNDVMFKLLWRESLDLLYILISLIINDINNEDLKSIYFTDTEQQISIDSKLTRLDIKVNTKSGIAINTEMQNDKRTAYMTRLAVYLSQSLIFNNKKVDKYKDFNKVVNLSILNYNEFDDDKIIHHIELCDFDTGKSISDIMQIYTFEVKKACDGDVKDPLTAWAKFFASKTREECMQTASLDPYVAKAVQIVNNLNLDENARSLTEMEDLKILDITDQLENAKDNGIEEGLAKGRVEGRVEGMQASHGEVWKTATNQALIDVAKNMLKINIPIDQIVLSTKLPKEEIYKLEK